MKFDKWLDNMYKNLLKNMYKNALKKFQPGIHPASYNIIFGTVVFWPIVKFIEKVEKDLKLTFIIIIILIVLDCK